MVDGVESDFRVGGLLGVEPKKSARKILDCQSSDTILRPCTKSYCIIYGHYCYSR